jgi:hypothetical protein
VVFYDPLPGDLDNAEMKIARYDVDQQKALTSQNSLQEYLDNEVNYSVVPFKTYSNPSNSWAMPYVTGHRYRIHWGEGIDFTQMRV